MEPSDGPTRLVHLVSRAAVRLTSPRRAKSLADRVAAMLPPLRGLADAKIAMKVLGNSGTCLTRALAVASRLPGAEIVIGVDPTVKPIPAAHAWVEFRGIVIETAPPTGDGAARHVAEIARLSATKHRAARASALTFAVALHQVTELFRRFR